jgi:hypothetical protein
MVALCPSMRFSLHGWVKKEVFGAAGYLTVGVAVVWRLVGKFLDLCDVFGIVRVCVCCVCRLCYALLPMI